VGTHVLKLNTWATWTPSNLSQPKSLTPTRASLFLSPFPLPTRALTPAAGRRHARPAAATPRASRAASQGRPRASRAASQRCPRCQILVCFIFLAHFSMFYFSCKTYQVTYLSSVVLYLFSSDLKFVQHTLVFVLPPFHVNTIHCP
jgi:hypothetical protein